jgi:ABC-2 type transport system ATP-binding protein
MIREGKLEELISVENQTEFLLDNAPPELVEEIQALVKARYPQTSILKAGKPHTTLERFFLDVTQSDSAD